MNNGRAMTRVTATLMATFLVATSLPAIAAENLKEVFTEGKFGYSFRWRLETVDQEPLPPEELLERALSFWNGYHDSTAATREGDRIVIGDPSLLLYYQNRLVPFAEDIASPEQLKAACEIEQLWGRQ